MKVSKATMCEKTLLFGQMPEEYLQEWQITCDLGLIERKLGVRIEQVPHGELMGRY